MGSLIFGSHHVLQGLEWWVHVSRIWVYGLGVWGLGFRKALAMQIVACWRIAGRSQPKP